MDMMMTRSHFIWWMHTLHQNQSRITRHWVIGWTCCCADILSRIIDHGHSDGEDASIISVLNVHCHSSTITILLILESEILDTLITKNTRANSYGNTVVNISVCDFDYVSKQSSCYLLKNFIDHPPLQVAVVSSTNLKRITSVYWPKCYEIKKTQVEIKPKATHRSL